MDKVREEFEAWLEENKHHILDDLKVGKEKAFWIWSGAYGVGRNASRRPVAMVKTFAKHQAVYSNGDLVRGGFDSVPEAREWAQSNGFEVYP